jgi:NAD(P)-dependent dehydrogenase (short-subunit alcohol dehydrogenase family)
MGICDGRVCIVTGAGRGIGREYALGLAADGARVVVNDLGGEMDGSGSPSTGPAVDVVDEIRAAGGVAVANGDDVSSFDGAARLIRTALDEFGDLHCLVNNAGILRDRMLVNMTEAEWDDVIRVHLKGTFAPMHHAANLWRDQARAAEAGERDRPIARVVNVTSVSGIYGNVGQTNYGAAKAGIASMTFIASMELARSGVTVNAIAPVALTRMTEGLGPERTDEQKDAASPRWIAPVVTWLASEESSHVTGRVFECSGRVLAVAEGWHRGPSTQPVDDAALVGDLIDELLATARPPADMEGRDRTAP